jgi:hypothetical protein
LEMVGDDRDNHGEIEIRMKAPGEIGIAFMRERRPRRRRNRFRRMDTMPRVVKIEL